MAVEKKNGDLMSFWKQKDYVMVDNDLGGGSFGKTVVLKDPYIDELFVAKKYEPEFEEIREVFYKNFLDEIKILYKLNHPNIVRIFNYYPYENLCTGYILMEFIDGVDIGSYFSEFQEIDAVLGFTPFPEDVFVQLIDAFCYIEEHQIIHRDIREGNIMIDKTGRVKVIDFGIGKIFSLGNTDDSLVSEINWANSDTLPLEFYSGKYTTLTDMFYLAELMNRMIATATHSDEIHFPYQDILEKMMRKNPSDRYQSFAEIREAIGKHDFINLDIPEQDKQLYRNFSNLVYRSIRQYNSEPKFITDTHIVLSRLQKALQVNVFEDVIQKNADIIGSIVSCAYSYDNAIDIPCETVRKFMLWFKVSTKPSQELILTNLIAKLSNIRYIEPDPELPF